MLGIPTTHPQTSNNTGANTLPNSAKSESAFRAFAEGLLDLIANKKMPTHAHFHQLRIQQKIAEATDWKGFITEIQGKIKNDYENTREKLIEVLCKLVSRKFEDTQCALKHAFVNYCLGKLKSKGIDGEYLDDIGPHNQQYAQYRLYIPETQDKLFFTTQSFKDTFEEKFNQWVKKYKEKIVQFIKEINGLLKDQMGGNFPHHHLVSGLDSPLNSYPHLIDKDKALLDEKFNAFNQLKTNFILTLNDYLGGLNQWFQDKGYSEYSESAKALTNSSEDYDLVYLAWYFGININISDNKKDRLFLNVYPDQNDFNADLKLLALSDDELSDGVIKQLVATKRKQKTEELSDDDKNKYANPLEALKSLGVIIENRSPFSDDPYWTFADLTLQESESILTTILQSTPKNCELHYFAEWTYKKYLDKLKELPTISVTGSGYSLTPSKPCANSTQVLNSKDSSTGASIPSSTLGATSASSTGVSPAKFSFFDGTGNLKAEIKEYLTSPEKDGGLEYSVSKDTDNYKVVKQFAGKNEFFQIYNNRVITQSDQSEIYDAMANILRKANFQSVEVSSDSEEKIRKMLLALSKVGYQMNNIRIKMKETLLTEDEIKKLWNQVVTTSSSPISCTTPISNPTSTPPASLKFTAPVSTLFQPGSSYDPSSPPQDLYTPKSANPSNTSDPRNTSNTGPGIII